MTHEFDPERLRLDFDPKSAPEDSEGILIWRSNAKAARKKAAHIGCPLKWFERVLPIVSGKTELAAALLLYRQRALQGTGKNLAETVTLGNGALSEIGLTRFAKYRMLSKLEAAGVVTVERENKSTARVRFND